MCMHVLDQGIVGLPEEPRLLADLTIRLTTESDLLRFNQLLAKEHYLQNPTVVGRVLRYIVEYRGEWVALIVFSSPAYHLKARDRWLKWSPREVQERRHWLAQNSRFLVLAGSVRWPNLGSRVLKLACDRLPMDWQKQFGEPVLAVESFVDPERGRGTCYKAAGWERLGPTQGYERAWKDFYTDTKHPKELWDAWYQYRSPSRPVRNPGSAPNAPTRLLYSKCRGHVPDRQNSPPPAPVLRTASANPWPSDHKPASTPWSRGWDTARSRPTPGSVNFEPTNGAALELHVATISTNDREL